MNPDHPPNPTIRHKWVVTDPLGYAPDETFNTESEALAAAEIYEDDDCLETLAILNVSRIAGVS